VIRIVIKMAETVNCGKCQQFISPSKDRAHCRECGNDLHLNGRCSGLQLTTWVAKGKKLKESWVCPDCRVVNNVSEPKSNITNVSDTPNTQITSASKKRSRMDVDDDGQGSEKKDGGWIAKEELALLVTEVVTKAVAESLRTIQSSISDLQVLVMAKDSIITDLKEENKDLRVRLDALETELDDKEQYSKRNNLIISGLPVTANENPIEMVEKIAHITGVHLEKWDVVAAHRLPSRNIRGKFGGNNDGFADHPFIIKFHSRFTKEKLMKNAREANLTAERFGGSRGIRVFFNDHLTKKKSALLRKAKILKSKDYEYKYVWCRNGQILVKKDQDAPAYRINNEADIEKLKNKVGQGSAH
jgi:hypothetical protein